MRIPRIIREPLLSVAATLGYQIFKINRERRLYGPVAPEATYSPWNKDERFLTVYETVRSHTLVDLYRCYELWNLVERVAPREGALLEVGVWRGGTGALIAKRAQLSGITDAVYLCDTFQGVVKASDEDSAYVGGEHADTSEKVVLELLQSLGLSNGITLSGIFPDDTGASIEQTKFRFCHIDVDVYQSAKDVVEWIWGRLIVGGVVVFDDYGFESTSGIARYVDEQARMPDRVTVHNLNGHAITIKTA